MPRPCEVEMPFRLMLLRIRCHHFMIARELTLNLVPDRRSRHQNGVLLLMSQMSLRCCSAGNARKSHWYAGLPLAIVGNPDIGPDKERQVGYRPPNDRGLIPVGSGPHHRGLSFI